MSICRSEINSRNQRTSTVYTSDSYKGQRLERYYRMSTVYTMYLFEQTEDKDINFNYSLLSSLQEDS